MEIQRLNILIESELYRLVLSNSQDEISKITLNSVSQSVVQFVEKYGEELTPENIDYLTQSIWEYINSKIRRNKKMLEDNIR